MSVSKLAFTYHVHIWNPSHKDSLLPGAGWTPLGTLPFPSQLPFSHPARGAADCLPSSHRLVSPRLQALSLLIWQKGRGGPMIKQSREWCQSWLDSFQMDPWQEHERCTVVCGNSPELLLKKCIPVPLFLFSAGVLTCFQNFQDFCRMQQQ